MPKDTPSAPAAAIEKADIVQILPKCGNPAFHYCLAVVDEVKSWGVQAYVQALGNDRHEPGGQAYIRLNNDEFEAVGAKAPYSIP